MQENELELHIRIDLRQPQMGGSGIALEQSATLTVASFLEAAKILGRFHDLVEELRKSQK